MIIQIEIPDYDDDTLEAIWDENAHFSVSVQDNQVAILANSAGLMSLGRQMIYMAYHDFPWGTHLHYDEFVTKEKNCSIELIIGKE